MTAYAWVKFFRISGSIMTAYAWVKFFRIIQVFRFNNDCICMGEIFQDYSGL